MIKEFWVHFASFARQKWTTTFLTQRTPILKFITFANTATLSELETNSIYFSKHPLKSEKFSKIKKFQN